MSEHWPKVPLHQVLKQVERPEAVDPERIYRLLGVRWYASGLFVKETCPGSSFQAAKVYKVVAGDFVYNRLFAWKGSFAIAQDDHDGCYVSNEFPCFVADHERLDTRYLHHFFSREISWVEALGLSSGGTPTSRNRLKEERFLAMTMPLPPLPAQRRIVAWIDELTGRITEASKATHEAEQVEGALLLSLYDRLVQDSAQLPMREVAPLVRRAVVVDPFESYPELGIRCFGKGAFHKPALLGSEVGNKHIYRIDPGDLVFSNVFAWEGAIAVSQPADAGRVGSHRFITCVPKERVASSEYLCFHFLTSAGLEAIGKASPGGAGRNRTLGLEALAKIEVPVPQYEKQLWFNGVQHRVRCARQHRKEMTENLNALLPSILDKAFRGGL